MLQSTVTLTHLHHNSPHRELPLHHRTCKTTHPKHKSQTNQYTIIPTLLYRSTVSIPQFTSPQTRNYHHQPTPTQSTVNPNQPSHTRPSRPYPSHHNHHFISPTPSTRASPKAQPEFKAVRAVVALPSHTVHLLNHTHAVKCPDHVVVPCSASSTHKTPLTSSSSPPSIEPARALKPPATHLATLI
ncbi:hypothetical protein M0R45_031123 [Rubus argutus]|uniref:Uncharacterized protein n=1 Tax=Rubus argutus TaxID=59490 RepID=A0AAW1WF24_RUBAR